MFYMELPTSAVAKFETSEISTIQASLDIPFMNGSSLLGFADSHREAHDECNACGHPISEHNKVLLFA